MDSAINESWFSLNWFSATTLLGYDWHNRLFLFGLLIIPLIFVIKWLVQRSFGQKLNLALPKEQIKWTPSVLLRHIPNFILALIVGVAVIMELM